MVFKLFNETSNNDHLSHSRFSSVSISHLQRPANMFRNSKSTKKFADVKQFVRFAGLPHLEPNLCCELRICNLRIESFLQT
jgi:hypothetical protein